MPAAARCRGRYGYDLLDRLNAASKTGTSQGWTYDANGNRLTQTGTTPSTYTNAGTSNRVSSIAGSLARTYALRHRRQHALVRRRHVHVQPPRTDGHRHQWRRHRDVHVQRARAAHQANGVWRHDALRVR